MREECAHKGDLNDGMRQDLKEKEREAKKIDGDLVRAETESRKMQEALEKREQQVNEQEQEIRQLED